MKTNRLKFDKNYVYSEYSDPNPEEGSFKEWRDKALFIEDAEVENESFYKVFFYHPTKHTKMLGFIVLGSQTIAELEEQIYWVWDYMLHEKGFDEEFGLKSFLFIEDVFYYTLKNDEDNDELIKEYLQEIDQLISKHNSEISK